MNLVILRGHQVVGLYQDVEPYLQYLQDGAFPGSI